MRHDVLVYAIDALRKHFHGRVIVADDSFEISDSVITELSNLDVELHRIGPDIGLSAGRNFLLQQVKSEKFLLMDSDFVLRDSNGIDKLQIVMEETDAAIVGGLLWDKGSHEPRNYCGYFDLEDGEIVVNLYDIPSLVKKSVDQVTYYGCRICQNFFLGNTEKFKRHNLHWNEEFKLMEHEDFFIRIPSFLKVFETPDVHVVHYPILEYMDIIPDYEGFRGVKMDETYSGHRHAPSHRSKVAKHYGLKGEFFQTEWGHNIDWTNGFPSFRRIKI
jgi:hypothetical protein